MKKATVQLKQELNRLRHQKDVLWAAILFLVAIVVLTGVSIFTSQKKVKIDSYLTELAKPLVPRLDSEVFTVIEAKRFLSDEELSYFPIYVYLVSDSDKTGVFTNITDNSIINEAKEQSFINNNLSEQEGLVVVESNIVQEVEEND